ncbi:MAG: non-homologous end-joining DNA ligase [Bacillota bacterium]|nr:non-homologous end-joining DNA ligase [Bacillota bacterium]
MAGTDSQRVSIQGRELALTNLDRVLWPEDGLTKGDLIEYLVRMAPVIMPHVRDRPLVLTRYPAGIAGESFYQKNLPQGAPDWVPTYRHQGPSSEREISYVLCDHPAVLAWLGNQAAIEIHPWFSRTDDVQLPDIACFDLDPVEPAGFDECRPIAWLVRRALDQFGLQAWLKTSGATGLHLYVPIQRRYGYRDIARAVGRISDAVHQTGQARTTRVRSVARRPPGTVYLDHLQNVLGKTLAMAYGPRPHPGAPVSAPIAWEELDTIQPKGLTLRTMPDRVTMVGDLFSGLERTAQDWTPVMEYFGRAP